MANIMEKGAYLCNSDVLTCLKAGDKTGEKTPFSMDLVWTFAESWLFETRINLKKCDSRPRPYSSTKVLNYMHTHIHTKTILRSYENNTSVGVQSLAHIRGILFLIGRRVMTNMYVM